MPGVSCPRSIDGKQNVEFMAAHAIGGSGKASMMHEHNCKVMTTQQMATYSKVIMVVGQLDAYHGFDCVRR